ncbi:hypothetical protein HPULCUR_008248 [Helicostylum pulchrum]|uniref:Thioredoxin domain-containing protein n=1 Tax=Helicostylum pulchrum TaxID=562976 RepID=A0ABP9Y7E3_9FUNG
MEKLPQVQANSNTIEASNALSLQRVGVSVYNQVIRMQSPELKLRSVPTFVICQFKTIYKISEETRKATIEAVIAMLGASGSVCACAAKWFLNETQEPDSTSTQQPSSTSTGTRLRAKDDRVYLLCYYLWTAVGLDHRKQARKQDK